MGTIWVGFGEGKVDAEDDTGQYIVPAKFDGV